MTRPQQGPAQQNAKQEPPLAIRVSNLLTHYDGRVILNNVSLEVKQGEIMVIMGEVARVKVRCCAICWGWKNPAQVISSCWVRTSPA